jgi:3-hydroxybutyryl-CoA dehydrogenase
MGPFELMDLVGIDVNLEVAKSFWEQSFHEPRWQPHPIQARMVAAGRLGRKSGRGYYPYSEGRHRAEDPEAPPPAPEPEPAPTLVSLEAGSLATQAPGADAVGYVALPDLGSARLVELARGPATTDPVAAAAERHFASLGKQVAWVGDSPGLVLGRIVAQLVNEAHFAVDAGVGSPTAVDTALRLGFNHPLGPFEWREAIGASRLVALLDSLRSELGEERYRAAPGLRRAASPSARS